MFEVDKQKFGAFVAALRKEKGLTQKELAARLYISDKAVSKWETGVSIPDMALLIPLSEALGVSVTELLNCRRAEPAEAMDPGQVEELVKKTIRYSEERPRRDIRGTNILIFLLCALAACWEGWLLYRMSCFPPSVRTVLILCGLFGFYFMVLAKDRLPAYYDENRITAFSDGPVRMNLGIVPIHNRNWPHLLKVLRVWSMAMLVLWPGLCLLAVNFAPGLYAAWERPALLVLLLGGLLVPLWIVGKKYQ